MSDRRPPLGELTRLRLLARLVARYGLNVPKERAQPAQNGLCPRCSTDAGLNWFDRSLCPCDDTMHTRCQECGYALDGCEFEEAVDV